MPNDNKSTPKRAAAPSKARQEKATTKAPEEMAVNAVETTLAGIKDNLIKFGYSSQEAEALMSGEELPERETAQDCSLLSYTCPADMLRLAKDLTKFVRDKELSVELRGDKGAKNYAQVEAWQYAGSRLGWVASVVSCTCTNSAPKELTYESVAVVVDMQTGRELGRGVSQCGQGEGGRWAYAKPYAVQSMSQTRSQGKAFRSLLAWVMKAAGFEATPAEEMMDIAKATEKAESAPQSNAPAVGPATPAQAAPEAPKAQESAQAAAPVSQDEEDKKLAPTSGQLELITKLINQAFANDEAKRKEMIAALPKLTRFTARTSIERLQNLVAQQAQTVVE